jgi:hypothetical protein
MEDTIKKYILESIEFFYVQITNNIPSTRKKQIFIHLKDIEPYNLIKFMEDNNIPKNVYFHSKGLCYDVDVQMTKKQKRDYIEIKFKNRIQYIVF